MTAMDTEQMIEKLEKAAEECLMRARVRPASAQEDLMLAEDLRESARRLRRNAKKTEKK